MKKATKKLAKKLAIVLVLAVLALFLVRQIFTLSIISTEEFETGLGTWDTSGDIALSTNHVHSGAYSAHCTVTGLGRGYKNVGSYNGLAYTGYVYIDSITSGTGKSNLIWLGGGQGYYFLQAVLMYYGGSYQIGMYDGISYIDYPSGTPVVIGHWYKIRLEATISTQGEIRMYLDDNLVKEAVHDTTDVIMSPLHYVGFGSAGYTGVLASAYYDDFSVEDIVPAVPPSPTPTPTSSPTPTSTPSPSPTPTSTPSGSHTLTMQSNPNGTVSPAEGIHSYSSGSSVVLTATPNLGYRFDYWLINGATDTDNPATITVISDITVVAVMPLQSSPPPSEAYVLTIQSNANGTLSPDVGTYSYEDGATVTLTATPNTGYRFDYWLINGATNTNNPATITVSSNTTVSAMMTLESEPPPSNITPPPTYSTLIIVMMMLVGALISVAIIRKRVIRH